MRTISGPTLASASRRLSAELPSTGVAWSLGTFHVSLRSDVAGLADSLLAIYGCHPLIDPRIEFVDFPVAIGRAVGPRRFISPQILFRADGAEPFDPQPRKNAPAMLEWGLNWRIATQGHWYLMLHAATLHRDGRAAIFPGKPGTGKSTLCTALIEDGWTLLSDEFALLSLSDGLLYPLWKPISLKERALDIFRERVPEKIAPWTFHSTKGRIGFYVPGFADGQFAVAPAIPAWVVMVSFEPGSRLRHESLPKSDAFVHAANNSFNYSLLGEAAFVALRRMMARSRSFYLAYSDLAEATAFFARLAEDGVAEHSAA